MKVGLEQHPVAGLNKGLNAAQRRQDFVESIPDGYGVIAGTTLDGNRDPVIGHLCLTPGCSQREGERESGGVGDRSFMKRLLLRIVSLSPPHPLTHSCVRYLILKYLKLPVEAC